VTSNQVNKGTAPTTVYTNLLTKSSLEY